MPGKNPASARPRLNRRTKKADRPLGEREGARDQAPADHDAADPSARADLFEDQVAWHFQEKIAPEESAGAKPKDIGTEADILVHGQRREPDVDAVQIADEIEDKAERQQPQIDLLHGLPFNRRFHGFLQFILA